ncbi:MAG: DUF4494 domain-containing protein [Bacteroidales bacterium]
MGNLYECTVQYFKEYECGTTRKTSELYLVNAMSFTEAEQRIIEELAPLAGESLTLKGVKQSRAAEVFLDDDADRWFKCRVAFVTLNERDGREKQTVVPMLVKANDIERAIAGLRKGMKETLADYAIVSVAEVPIRDFIQSN